MEVKSPSINKVISGTNELIESLFSTLSLSGHIEHSLSFNVPSYRYRLEWIILD